MRLKSHITYILFLLFILGPISYGNAQNSRNVLLNLPDISLIDIEPVGAISISFSSPGESGKALLNPSPNTSKWLNYTSAVAVGSTKKVTVACNTLVPGIDIKLQAGAAAGAGAGTRGISTGAVTLSTTAKTIITGIGGAYTGDGINNGHQITISVIANTSNYSLIRAQTNTQVQLTYTISAN